jgi:putative tryptophan/tyrosine transport system substrate-binding protein
MTRDRPYALNLAANPAYWINRQTIAEFVTKHRMPSIYLYREIAYTGGQMSYGSNPIYLFRLAASFVDKIRRGAKPANLTVEQTTKIEFIVDLKTAAAIALAIPSTLSCCVAAISAPGQKRCASTT